MQTDLLQRFSWCSRRLPQGLLVASLATTAAHAQLTSAIIDSIQSETTNIVVKAQVPVGVLRVTLECRDRFGGGAWEPRAVVRLDGSGGPVTFRLARSRPFEALRVRADATEPLPASFYAGTNSFYQQFTGSGSPVDVRGPMDSIGNTAPTQDAPRDVVESDIWKIRGQTLYFFNQLRGLQVIDLSNPDTPAVRGTLDLPAAGEDMYLLDDKYVVLLVRDGCGYNDNQVVVVADSGAQPSVVARLPVTGYIQESR